MMFKLIARFRAWRLRKAMKRYAAIFYRETPLQRYIREKHSGNG